MSLMLFLKAGLGDDGKFDISAGRGYNLRHECDEWHCETTPDAPGNKRRGGLVHRDRTARQRGEISRRPQGGGRRGMTKPASPLIPDVPISSRKDDVFGRAKFAENLAKSIAGVPAEDGFVFALNATWGSGKTSTLNMIREALEDDAKTDGKQFITVQFNPWWFSGGNFLVQDFFRQFQGALIEQGGNGKKHRNDIRKLAGQIRTFSSALTPFPLLGGWAKLVRDVSGGVERLFPNLADNINEVRKEICDSLRKMPDFRVLVVMDDLDRIQPNEIREMFRLVKGVADFPNTIYLLSFDRGAVADAISGEIGGVDKAEKYLGKIIQMSLDLPPVEESVLRKYFDGQLAKVFPVQTEEWDTGYWWDIFSGKASHFVKTPRDVKRWINNSAAIYPMVREEVNPVDFVAIQGMRTFIPDIYHVIGENKRLFVDVQPESPVESFIVAVKDEMHPTKKEENLKKEAHALLKASFQKLPVPIGEIADQLAKVIFPFWDSHFQGGGISFPPSHARFTLEEAHERKMARHPEIFHVYFHLSLPFGHFSAREMIRLIDRADNPHEFANTLMGLASEMLDEDDSRLRVFLERLLKTDMHDRMLRHAHGVLCAFLMVSDKPQVDNAKLLSLGRENAYAMCRIAQILLQKIPDEEERFRIFRDAFAGSEAVMSLWEWMHMLQYDVDKQERRLLLSEEHTKEVKEIAMRKLRAAAKEGDAWNWRSPRRLMSIMHRELEEKEWRDCASKVVSKPEGLAALCALDGYENSPQEMERITGIERKKLANAASRFLISGLQLNEAQKNALSYFVEQVKGSDKNSDE